MIKNSLIKLYGLFAYILGLVSLVAFTLFANNGFVHVGIWLDNPTLGAFSIDVPALGYTDYPLMFNIGLLLLFGLQHSVMARPGFKAGFTKIVPRAAERSSYVLATALVLFAMIFYWHPMVGLVWQVDAEWARTGIHILYWVGFLITFLATQMIDGMHLMGVKQSFSPDDPDKGTKNFVTPGFYKLVRHPIQTGIVIAMIATPDMTVGRLTLAVGMLVYVGIGLYYEEKDLIGEFGDTYRDYKTRVPALFPKFW